MTERRGTMPAAYRADQGLNDEARRILAGLSNAVIATLDRDGLIHLAPVWFLYADDRLYFETSSATRKARNVGHRGTASVLVTGKTTDGSTMTVLAPGTGRLLQGAEGRRIRAALRRKYLADEGYDALEDYLDSIDDIAVEITPARFVVWTGSVIDNEIRSVPQYAEGKWDEWFLPDR